MMNYEIMSIATTVVIRQCSILWELSELEKTEEI